MPSEIDICNMALSHLGISTVIASLTEKSKEAQACAAFYESTRDEVLRDFVWPFATKFELLALEAEQPTIEWLYSYRMPADKIYFRRILNGGSRLETQESRIPFRVLADATGELVYADIIDPVAEYTFRVTDPLKFPADFTRALTLRIAGFIAPRVTGGDQFKLGVQAWQLYDAQIHKAWKNAANEGQSDLEIDSELIRVRD